MRKYDESVPYYIMLQAIQRGEACCNVPEIFYRTAISDTMDKMLDDERILFLATEVNAAKHYKLWVVTTRDVFQIEMTGNRFQENTLPLLSIKALNILFSEDAEEFKLIGQSGEELSLRPSTANTSQLYEFLLELATHHRETQKSRELEHKHEYQDRHRRWSKQGNIVVDEEDALLLDIIDVMLPANMGDVSNLLYYTGIPSLKQSKDNTKKAIAQLISGNRT